MYILILNDIVDAFFPEPTEVQEKYETREEAMTRVKEIVSTYLSCTYDPVALIHPDGKIEDLNYCC